MAPRHDSTPVDLDSESAVVVPLEQAAHAGRDTATVVNAVAYGGDVVESSGLYSLLVASVKDYAIFALDSTGHVLSWNEGAERIKGYRSEEIIGRHFSVFYPPEDIASNKTAWELEVAAHEGRFEDEGWRVRKDGSRFWANVVITVLRDSDGRLVGFAKVTRDLTERRQAEERAVNDARRIAAAEAASRTKSEFLAMMSHELRTPLNAIGGHLQLLMMGIYGPTTDGQLEALKRIDRSQRHLLGLINDILNLARIEAGRVDYRLEDVVLEDVVRELAPMVEPQFGAKQLTYEVCLPTPSFIVRADREKLTQILLNLLSNAAKFTPAGGHVTLDAVTRPGALNSVFVRVTDTGIGIPGERLEAIFEPFVQVHTTRTRTTEGTGLGLAISRDLARGMGGDLRVRSTEGKGSTFTLRLVRAMTP
jgi:PAS domain S-box-containing protein